MKDRYNELTIATVYRTIQKKKEQHNDNMVLYNTKQYFTINDRQKEKKWLNQWKLLNKQQTTERQTTLEWMKKQEKW